MDRNIYNKTQIKNKILNNMTTLRHLNRIFIRKKIAILIKRKTKNYIILNSNKNVATTIIEISIKKTIKIIIKDMIYKIENRTAKNKNIFKKRIYILIIKIILKIFKLIQTMANKNTN